jgi:cytidylate kinase
MAHGESGHHGHVAELIVVTGPPGAGKTTAAHALSALFERSALVAGDDFFAFIDQGYIAPWTGEAHQQNDIVIGAAAAAAGRLAVGGYTVVFDGVIGPWFLRAFTAATCLGAVHYVVLLPPERTCVERVRSRAGHGFADLDATGTCIGSSRALTWPHDTCRTPPTRRDGCLAHLRSRSGRRCAMGSPKPAPQLGLTIPLRGRRACCPTDAGVPGGSGQALPLDDLRERGSSSRTRLFRLGGAGVRGGRSGAVGARPLHHRFPRRSTLLLPPLRPLAGRSVGG